MSRAATAFLYATVFIEGYVVLAVELLAIRLLLPFVGSGTEIVAIVVGGVLLPLAAGYHVGGTRARRMPIRRLLLRNMLLALGILVFGLSDLFLEALFGQFESWSLPRLWQTTCYVALFLTVPVFLLAQTVPLVSHFFRGSALSHHTGRMLFLSTAGSFFGSIFSTLWLMNWIGVHATSIVTLALLTLLGLALCCRHHWRSAVLALTLLALAVALNHPDTVRSRAIFSANSYNTVRVVDAPGEPQNRLLQVNRSNSSKYAERVDERFAYVAYIERYFIAALSESPTPRRILVLGAGGFTMGQDDTRNQYVYVDIDPALKTVAEKYFLKKPLRDNQQFVPLSARAFLRQDTGLYDLIVIDTYSHVYSLPAETTTVEFLEAARRRLTPDGVLVVNLVANARFADRFSRRYDNTFAHVFPHYTRQVIGPYNPWETTPGLSNLLYIYYAGPAANKHYTDDWNPFSLDRP